MFVSKVSTARDTDYGETLKTARETLTTARETMTIPRDTDNTKRH